MLDKTHLLTGCIMSYKCTYFYLTICTFSFEIKESNLSDKRCLVQEVVPPNCSDKRMAWSCLECFCQTTFFYDVIVLECGKKHLNAINVSRTTVQCSFFHMDSLNR